MGDNMIRFTIRELRKIDEYVFIIAKTVEETKKSDSNEIYIPFIHPSFRKEIEIKLITKYNIHISFWGPLGNNIHFNNGLPYQEIKLKNLNELTTSYLIVRILIGIGLAGAISIHFYNFLTANF